MNRADMATAIAEGEASCTLSPMTTLRIYDAPAGFLAFDLKDILALLQPRSDRSEWEVDHADEDFEATGRDIREIEALVGTGERVPGDVLHALAKGLHQVIWGEFRAFEASATKPWVIIRAIDSSFFEIETKDDAILALVREHFNVVQEVD